MRRRSWAEERRASKRAGREPGRCHAPQPAVFAASLVLFALLPGPVVSPAASSAAAAAAGGLPGWKIASGSAEEGLVLGIRGPLAREGGAQARAGVPPVRETPLADPALARAAARADRFVAAHGAGLGVSGDRLLALAPRRAGRLLFLDYQQMHAGLPVLEGRLSVACDLAGEPLLFASRLAPEIDPLAAAPRVSAAQARQSAVRAIAAIGEAADATWPRERLAVLPAGPRSASPGRDRLVWDLVCRTHDPAGLWRILVDAHSAEPIEARSLAASADAAAGIVLGLARRPWPWSPEETVPFTDLAVRITAGDSTLAAGFTDSAGRFDLGEVAGAGLRLRASLAGRNASVHRGDRSVAPPEWEGAPRDTLLWDETVSTAAEREAYLATSRIHGHLRGLSPATGSEDDPFLPLDRPVTVVVDAEGMACNAIAYPDLEDPELFFSAASGDCPAFGRLEGIVFHEYAHLITACAYAPDFAPDGLQEAFADFQCASLSDTALVGLGYSGPGTSLRDLRHDLVAPLPPICETEPHCNGLLLAGVLWDLRAGLIRDVPGRRDAIALADALFHFMRLGRPASREACLWLLLLQDDEDGDLANGTPHLEAIAGAFERHRIGDFRPHLDHAALGDRPASSRPDTVRAEAWALYPIRRVLVHYRTNGGAFTAVPCLPGDVRAAGPAALPASAASGTSWSATLPIHEEGSTIDYYLTAEDEALHETRLPASAPSEVFSYRVGADEEPPAIFTRPLPAALTPGERLCLLAALLDNRGPVAPAAVHARVLRGGAAVREGDWTLLALAAGSMWHEAWIDPPGLEAGDRVRCRISALDLSGNESHVPESGEFEVAVARGRAWDFEVEAGDLALEGWSRASVTPLDPFFPAPSGTGAMHCAPDGSAAPGDSAFLTTPVLDLSDWIHARLEFSTTGADADGGIPGSILVRGSLAEPWRPVASLPSLPFPPDPQTGEASGWSRVAVPLEERAGGGLQVRLVFVPDGGEDAAAGWTIDDLRIVEVPALAAPRDLSASEGEDGRVTLTWLPPEDPAAPLGYRIYRSHFRGAGEPSSGTIETTSWVDESCENGLTYFYSVASLYPSGESPRSQEAAGRPYRTSLSLPGRIEGTFDLEGLGTDTLQVANTGSGPLALEFFTAGRDDRWEDLAIRIPIGQGTPWNYRVEAEDPADSPPPDLRDCSTREVSGRLVLRLRFHEPIPDPRASFTLLMLLDTDDSRATGVAGRAVGADLLVALGRAVLAQSGGADVGYFLNDRYEVVARPSGLILHEGLDSLEFAIPLALLGGADTVACEIEVQLAEEAAARLAFSSASEPDADASARASALRRLLAEGLPGDRFPDPPSAGWLGLSAFAGVARPGAPFPLTLDYDVGDPADGQASAKLFVRSNDPERPVVSIPVTVRREAGDWITHLSLARPAPNPFSDATVLRLAIPAGTDWRVRIVDAAGRGVRRLAAGRSAAAEERALSWDGRTDSGGPAAAGCYFAVGEADGRLVSRRLIRIR